MDVDDDVDEVQDIRQLVEKLERTRIIDVETYRALLSMECTSDDGKRALIGSVLRLYEKKRPLPMETQAFALNVLEDESNNIRRYACQRLTLLCADKRHIEIVVGALADIIARGVDEAPTARKSLQKIIKDHMAEAFGCFPSLIEEAEAISSKLELLRFLNEELERHGTVGDKMKKIVQGIFRKMIKNAKKNNVDEVEGILVAAAQTSFFPTRVEKRYLTNEIAANETIHIGVMFDEVNHKEMHIDEMVSAFKMFNAISKWIDGPNPIAFYGVAQFLNAMESFSKAEEAVVASCVFHSTLLEKVCFLTQHRPGTENAMKYISPEHLSRIGGVSFAEYFRVVWKCMDKIYCSHNADENMLDIFEKLLIIAYDLLPNPDQQRQFLKDRERWETEARQVFRQMSRSSELLKDELNEKGCREKDEKETQLRKRLNIGVLLIEFLAPKLKRTQNITPSWLRKWTNPKPAKSASNAKRIIRKRKRSGSVEELAVEKKRPHRATQRSGGMAKRRRKN